MPDASTKTINDLRDRIRTQLESASGFTEPLVVTASSIALTTATTGMRARVQARLQDASAARWSTDDVDEAIRTAIEYYSRTCPYQTIGTITVAAATKEQSLASLTGLIRVEKIWWDYDSSDPSYPPNWRQFEVWPGAVLYIDDRETPAVNDVLRVWYTKQHTLNGLDSASTTTIPAEDVDCIIAGAAHYAARQRAIELAEQATVDDEVVERLTKWADDEGDAFRYLVRQKPPAWQRYAYSYDQGDIDEAIRWTLYRYTEVYPQHKIASLTLAAAGREVDISSLTGYIDIQRIWWEYTSTAPEYPPNWRDFEVWPGDIVFINDGEEPGAGDKVRVFYTLPHTLNGLDSATATTIPERDINLIVTGATGFAAEERVQEQPQRNVPRKLREWGTARLREFERGLTRLARREAAKHSGIATIPDLDRWDTDRSGGW
jgi:hypothetical protein